MDLVTTAALSGWGIAAALTMVAAVAGGLLLRGRRSVATFLVGAAVAAGLSAVATTRAVPRVAAIELRFAAETGLGLAARELNAGYNVEAAAALDRAEVQFRDLGRLAGDAPRQSREGLARIELARGDVERVQGRLPEAKARYATAAMRLNTLGHPDTAWALLRLGHVELALNDAEAARRSYGQAIPLFIRFGMARGEAEARLAAGALARQSGAFGEAVTNLEAAMHLFDDPLGQGRAMVELAWVSQALRHTAVALAQASNAEDLFRAANAPFGLVLAPFVGAEIAIEDEEGEVAHAHLDRAQAALESMDDALAGAARYLGLSATSQLRTRASGSATVAYPDHHAEARMLLDTVTSLIGRGRNQADAVQ